MSLSWNTHELHRRPDVHHLEPRGRRVTTYGKGRKCKRCKCRLAEDQEASVCSPCQLALKTADKTRKDGPYLYVDRFTTREELAENLEALWPSRNAAAREMGISQSTIRDWPLGERTLQRINEGIARKLREEE